MLLPILTALLASASAAAVVSERGIISLGSYLDKVSSKYQLQTPCIDAASVDTLVSAYVRMITKWDDADAVYLANNFSDVSDSINSLAGIPLGKPTFPTKQAFIEHQHVQPDNLPMVISRRGPTSCNETSLIWTTTFGKPQKSVRGLTILGFVQETTSSSSDSSETDSDSALISNSDSSTESEWKIATMDVEFNSIGYLQNINGTARYPDGRLIR